MQPPKTAASVGSIRDRLDRRRRETGKPLAVPIRPGLRRPSDEQGVEPRTILVQGGKREVLRLLCKPGVRRPCEKSGVEVETFLILDDVLLALRGAYAFGLTGAALEALHDLEKTAKAMAKRIRRRLRDRQGKPHPERLARYEKTLVLLEQAVPIFVADQRRELTATTDDATLA